MPRVLICFTESSVLLGLCPEIYIVIVIITTRIIVVLA